MSDYKVLNDTLVETYILYVDEKLLEASINYVDWLPAVIDFSKANFVRLASDDDTTKEFGLACLAYQDYEIIVKISYEVARELFISMKCR